MDDDQVPVARGSGGVDSEEIFHELANVLEL